MTKKEIVRTISEETGLTQLKTKEVVQKTFDSIVDVLLQEGRVELRNFGVFEIKRRFARPGRNPKTGEAVEVPDRWVVTFKPGKEMDARVETFVAKDDREEVFDTVNIRPGPYQDQPTNNQ